MTFPGQRELSMKRVSLWVLCILGGMSTMACRPKVDFSRHTKETFKQVVSVPDEAVIYMQNLALMRDKVAIPKDRHVELVLPPRIISESLQLRSGENIIHTFNVKRGKYTRVRIRNIQRYVKPKQPLIVEYLTWGLYWSARYRVDILPNERLRLQLGAQIQNNWYNLSGMKVTLVAGFVGGALQRSASAPRSSMKNGLASNVGLHSRETQDESMQPSPMLASLGSGIPASALKPRMRRNVRRVRVARYMQKARRFRWRKRKFQAFSSEVLTRYKIRKVDMTGSRRKSNFQRQFSRYYRKSLNINRVSGYALYHGLRVHMRRHERTMRWVASVKISAKTTYVWPADQGDGVFIKYNIKNNSKILFPVGSAWLYRENVFVGQDVCLWTPMGASTSLLTSNDGRIAVNKRVVFQKNNTTRIYLKVQNFAKKPIEIEVFDRNPAWNKTGQLTFSVKPLTANQNSYYHRWKLAVPASTVRQIVMSYQPRPQTRRAPMVQPSPRLPVRRLNRNAPMRAKPQLKRQNKRRR